MARAPVIVSQTPVGQVNPAVSGGRVARPPQIKLRGPGQGFETFVSKDLPESVNRALNTMQRNVDSAVTQAKGNPFADGVLLTGVAFTNGTVTLTHGLGRAFRGYIVMNVGYTSGTNVGVHLASTDMTKAAQEIRLTAHASFSADVWVY